MYCEPVTVPLNLIDPVGSGRRGRFEERETGLDPTWYWVEREVRLGGVSSTTRLRLGNLVALQ
ncbi:hypothetical protein D3C71_1109470 [compost metagenome]